ncbi:hypothetical protein ACQE3E_16380 [Methylomonas sp. MED-D]|uniref:hypothetical protein n=1 Tax=unclassified Methylomonas TaxID=2608980 RepID=UPI0028A2F779|nr:hypothetical protein [Methylomonas sp. MV1]MDT4331065.1 hypothetical protein [Methylomonas sp. MV1]
MNKAGCWSVIVATYFTFLIDAVRTAAHTSGLKVKIGQKPTTTPFKSMEGYGLRAVDQRYV